VAQEPDLAVLVVVVVQLEQQVQIILMLEVLVVHRVQQLLVLIKSLSPQQVPYLDHV
jgi:hypothetical protein